MSFIPAGKEKVLLRRGVVYEWPHMFVWVVMLV